VILFAELLSVSNNNFTGTLVDAFGDLKAMDTLDLGQNRFSGTVPATIFSISSLRLLYLSSNSFIGNIPANFGNALKLRDLYLSDNQLEGPIPPILAGQLQNLTEFLLQNNALTGTMPESICTLTEDGNGVLEDLWSDCEIIDGVAEVSCTCCTQCVFETGALV
jgi:Leucine-rich repeat (LRR) protein